jgi:hypothetical protein
MRTIRWRIAVWRWPSCEGSTAHPARKGDIIYGNSWACPRLPARDGFEVLVVHNGQCVA